MEKFTILLVDASQADVDLVQSLLKDVRIWVADSVEGALSFLEQGRHPSLVLLDINLQGLSGFQLLRDVKKRAEWLHLPVVLFTTSPTLSEVQKAYLNYANAVVSKPLDLRDFEETLKRMVRFWKEVEPFYKEEAYVKPSD